MITSDDAMWIMRHLPRSPIDNSILSVWHIKRECVMQRLISIASNENEQDVEADADITVINECGEIESGPNIDGLKRDGTA